MLFDVQESQMEATLTKRQAEFLEAYRTTGSTGKSAAALGVAEDTARGQLRGIAKKLGFSSIKDLAGVDRKRSIRASPSQLMDLLKKQEFRCAMSGDPLVPSNTVLDHIVAKSNGGSDAIENLQWLEREVNRMKGALSNERFIALCGKVWNKANQSARP